MILASPEIPNALYERCIIGLIRILIRLLYKDDFEHLVKSSLSYLKTVAPHILNLNAVHMMSGVLGLVKTHPRVLDDSDYWAMIIGLIQSTSLHVEASAYSLEITAFLLTLPVGLSVDHFGEVN